MRQQLLRFRVQLAQQRWIQPLRGLPGGGVDLRANGHHMKHCWLRGRR
jgi:hypothetical protein